MSFPVGPLRGTSPNDRIVLGTAFAVDRWTLVTAFHCIGDRRRGEVYHGQVIWEFDEERLAATYLAGNPAADCALLRLAFALPRAVEPLCLSVGPAGESWRATGFPASLADIGEVSISGTVTNPHNRLFGAPAVQLFAEQSGAGLALGGFSGAPVFRPRDGAVIGVIRYNPPRPDALELGVGGIVFACPSITVIELLRSVDIAPRLATDDAGPGELDGDQSGAGALLMTLPPDRADFTGRIAEIEAVVTALSQTTGRSAVVAIYGQPGVGKSALAIRVAHLVAGSYPDGLLHVNLEGAARQPLTATEACVALLGALGATTTALPPSEQERIALYQRLLAGKRRLVVLDNARSVSQVRLLVPAGPANAALVTSRVALATLDTTKLLALDALDESDAATLLRRILGDDIRTTDAAGIAEIVRLCERLPLALRIAAAQLRSRPHWTVAHFVIRLKDEQRRLALLEVADLAVRTSFDISYDNLDPAPARAFAALGNVSAPDFPSWVLAALLNVDAMEAEDIIEQLSDAQLVSFARLDTTGTLRYRFHDLLRLYAREKAAEMFTPQEQSTAVARLLSGFLRLAVAGVEGLASANEPLLSTSVELHWQPTNETIEMVKQTPAMRWFADERPSLVAAIRQAHATGLWPYTWGLADALEIVFARQHHGDESLEVKELALDAARKAGDREAQAGALLAFSALYLHKGAHSAAVQVLREAMELYKSLGLSHLYVRTMLGLGVVERDGGDLPHAAEHLAWCVEAFQAAGDELFLVQTMYNYAIVLREQCRLAEAMKNLDLCLPVFVAHEHDGGRANTLHTRAVLFRYIGRLDAAEADLRAARRLFDKVGDVHWTAIVDLSLLRLLGQRGKWHEALDQMATCEKMFDDIDDLAGRVQVWRTRGVALRALGDLDGSLTLLEQARRLSDSIDDRRTQARLRFSIALTQFRRDNVDSAFAMFRDVEQRCLEIDDQPWLLRSRRWLARLTDLESGTAAAQPLWKDVSTLTSRLLDLAGPTYRPLWLEQVSAEARKLVGPPLDTSS
jgi:tetratricopeptide (TPR) repeat protein